MWKKSCPNRAIARLLRGALSTFVIYTITRDRKRYVLSPAYIYLFLTLIWKAGRSDIENPRAKRWKNLGELKNYTISNDLYFPREEAKRDGSLLRYLLRKILAK